MLLLYLVTKLMYIGMHVTLVVLVPQSVSCCHNCFKFPVQLQTVTKPLGGRVGNG